MTCFACDQHCRYALCRYCAPFDDRSIRDADDLRSLIRSRRGLSAVQVIDSPRIERPFQSANVRKWKRPVERQRRTRGQH